VAIDSKEKRAAVLGVGRPWMRDKFPIATPDEEWRIASGNAYGGNALSAPDAVESIGVSSTFWGVFAPQESGQLTDLTGGAVSGTGTVVLQGHHQTGGVFGAAAITTDGTNAAVIQIRKNNASGDLLLDVSTKQPMIETSLIRVSDTQVIYYSVTGTGAKVQLFEWTA